jgi:endonuclease III-like uncharacterized protein
MIICFVISFIIWIYDRISPYGYYKSKSNELNFSNSLLNSYFSLSLYFNKLGNSWSVRIVLIGFYAYALILSSSYTANLG